MSIDYQDYYQRNRERILARVNEWNHTHRDELRERNRERRAWLKAHGRCPACGKKAKKPRVLCADCLDYGRMYRAMKRKDRKDDDNAR